MAILRIGLWATAYPTHYSPCKPSKPTSLTLGEVELGKHHKTEPFLGVYHLEKTPIAKDILYPIIGFLLYPLFAGAAMVIV
ncbi:hypothetical protein RCC89_00355 [Cytophagaceae bacterium ABcell3]|nr:hypothetical protein RCC89_00355 [Cytophagaceae bacterium ABcell3]